MKLFNYFSAPGYHTSIITTFGVDFKAYESIALPRLREAGCNNNILIADARMLAHAMDSTAELPQYAGRHYSAVGAFAHGVFHPKIILQLGNAQGRLLVASANMSLSGLAGNLEVTGEVRFDERNRESIQILRSSLEFLARTLDKAPVSRRQVDWAMKRTRWLTDSSPSEPIIQQEGGQILGFLGSGVPKGIGQRFVEFVRGRPVKRLIIMSPYWDYDLGAVRQLRTRLKPAQTCLLIQAKMALFPKDALKKSGRLHLFEVPTFGSSTSGRFAHAKVIIAETNGADCVLYGSANCTTAALGIGAGAGTNEEACLYRELPAGSAVKELGLKHAIVSANELKERSLYPLKQPAELPLDEIEARLPGRFELSAGLLTWWPPAAVDLVSARIELFDSKGVALECSLTKLDNHLVPVTYSLSDGDGICFARVYAPGFESSLAIVVVESAIQDAQRRAMSKEVKAALAFLTDEEAHEGLWMLDIIQKLAAADQREGASSKTTVTPSPQRTWQDEKPAQESSVLTYEQFIAGRKASNQVGEHGRSHLGTSHNESVRSFLNLLIGTREGGVLVNDADSTSDQPVFSMGDETSDGEDALETGQELNNVLNVGGQLGEKELKEELRRRQQYVKDTEGSIQKAVVQFLRHLKAGSKTRPLGPTDVLKVRAMLMVILSAGSKESNLLPTDLNSSVSRRQVLSSKGDSSWRRLAGQLLWGCFSNFESSDGSFVSCVEMDADSGAVIPLDILECWATCYWAVCARHVAVDERGISFHLSPSELKTASDLYKATALRPSELQGESLKAVFAGLCRRYGERLGVSTTALEQEHHRLWLKLAGPPMTG